MDSSSKVSDVETTEKETKDRTSIDIITKEETPEANNVPAPLSKNQKRKLARIERSRAQKRQRKELQKRIRVDKAKAEGRDLEQERIRQEQAERLGRDRRIQEWQKHYAPDTTFSVVVDCSFEDKLVSKELNSLAIQLRYIYSANKKSKQPVELVFSSIDADKTIMQHLRNVGGFKEWGSYGLTVTPFSVEQVFSERIDDLVYLTSDATATIEALDNSKIYIIGGIVDRNRLKGATLERAKALNIPTRRLPITEHLKSMPTTKVLTCKHVFDLMLLVREYKGDWQKALLEVLPSRKDAKANEPNE